jgi:hypothetical protein
MKKNLARVGLVFLSVGVVLLLAAIFGAPGPLKTLAWGLAGGAIGPGLLMLGLYFYWSSPSRAALFVEKQRPARHAALDARKIMLRARAGRAAYLLLMAALVLLVLLFSVLNAFSVTVSSRALVFLFCGLLIFGYLCGAAAYRHYEKKL